MLERLADTTIQIGQDSNTVTQNAENILNLPGIKEIIGYIQLGLFLWLLFVFGKKLFVALSKKEYKQVFEDLVVIILAFVIILHPGWILDLFSKIGGLFK